MSKKWTPAQLSAIQTHGRTLLISAAAGSGKTATLTERIIQRVTDPEHPVDLSRLLIVTFTKAAASELKQRISKALAEAIAADPGNRHLQNQLIRLGSAHISTIDAFCYQPVKQHFAESGMPATFRIADEAELLPLRQRMMHEVIDEFYERYGSSDEDASEFWGILQKNPFADLCDSLSTFKNDDGLFKTLDKLYQELLNFPEGIDRLRLEAEQLKFESENDFFLSQHGHLLYEWTTAFCHSALPYYKKALFEIEGDPAAEKAYGESLLAEYEFAKALESALTLKSYQKARTVIHAFVPKSLKACRNPARDYSDLKKRRKKYLEDIDKFREEYYAATAETVKADMQHLASNCFVLYDFF